MSDVLVLAALLGVLDDPLLVFAAGVLPLVDDGSVVLIVSIDVDALPAESFDVEGVGLSINSDQFEDLPGLVLVLGSDDLGLVVVVVSLNGDVVSLLVLDLALAFPIHLQGEFLVVSSVDIPEDGLTGTLGGLGNVQSSSGLFSLDGVEFLVRRLHASPLVVVFPLVLLLPGVVLFLLLLLVMSLEHLES